MMSWMGSFILVAQAIIGNFDKFFVRLGSSDDSSTSKLTFMLEMIEMSNIFHNAKNNSLVIIDERGQEISTYDIYH